MDDSACGGRWDGRADGFRSWSSAVEVVGVGRIDEVLGSAGVRERWVRMFMVMEVRRDGATRVASGSRRVGRNGR